MKKAFQKLISLGPAYWATFIISTALFVAGFLFPPPGEIHNSVLIAVGMLMLFTTISMAISHKTPVKLNLDAAKKKLSLSTSDNKDEQKIEDSTQDSVNCEQ